MLMDRLAETCPRNNDCFILPAMALNTSDGQYQDFKFDTILSTCNKLF